MALANPSLVQACNRTSCGPAMISKPCMVGASYLLTLVGYSFSSSLSGRRPLSGVRGNGTPVIRS